MSANNPFRSFRLGGSREVLKAANARRISCVARACSKLRLSDDVRPYARIAGRVAFSYPKAVAQHCTVGILFHAHLGSDLRLRDYRVVIPKIDDIAVRIVAEEVSITSAVQ